MTFFGGNSKERTFKSIFPSKGVDRPLQLVRSRRRPFMALKSRQTTLSPLNEMFDGSKTKSLSQSPLRVSAPIRYGWYCGWRRCSKVLVSSPFTGIFFNFCIMKAVERSDAINQRSTKMLRLGHNATSLKMQERRSLIQMQIPLQMQFFLSGCCMAQRRSLSGRSPFCQRKLSDSRKINGNFVP